jgi:molecular chaperone GrpE
MTERDLPTPDDEAVDAAVGTPPDGADGEPDTADEALRELARERDDYKDKWLRAHAELDNVRKRARREIAEAQTFAVADVLRDLLDVLDNFERAAGAAAAAPAGDAEAIRSGVGLIHGRLREILGARGLTPIPTAKGDPFDPGIHEAVMQMDGEGVESGAVLEVAQAGYRLGDLVLRPCRVVVAR